MGKKPEDMACEQIHHAMGVNGIFSGREWG
jgi:hypothetical protein